ncbi:MAG TPA: Rid family detoxifying hydrolase [Longimicrobiales bacterium]|nr:Rid family detoxifying hydrolase [Longimicrobiales bacterium]
MKKPVIVLLCTIVFAGRAAAQEPAYLSAPDVRASLPFSEAVRVGNMLYLSGSIGVVPGTLKLAEGGIAAETKQTLENIRTIVERHGSSMDRVVKCLVMMADMSEWAKMNETYITFFPKNKPARSAVGASGLALNARVEIECVAVVGK